MFINNIIPDREQYMFTIRTAVILTASNYARRKVIPILESGVLKELCDLFVLNFNKETIIDKDSLRRFIFNCSSKLDNYLGVGFSLFCINLIIKKMSVLYRDDFKLLLDAPLNRDELIKANTVVLKMSDLNYENYIDVMNDASNYAVNNGASCLFEWELKEYNK